MVNKRLLEKELNRINLDRGQFKSIKYIKDLLPSLFKKYNNFAMEEEYYCCHGVEQSCWVEIIEEGVWGYSLDTVKRKIYSAVKEARKYLYKARKYGGNRIWVHESNEGVFVFIYLRDVMGVDYNIWFNN